MAREKKARHKFQMSSAKENMLPRPGSTHTRTVAVSGNLRRVRETPRVMRSAGEAVTEAMLSHSGDFGGMFDGAAPADLDETALQYIDPELVRRKRYAASVCVYDCIGLEMLKHCSGCAYAGVVALSYGIPNGEHESRRTRGGSFMGKVSDVRKGGASDLLVR